MTSGVGEPLRSNSGEAISWPSFITTRLVAPGRALRTASRKKPVKSMDEPNAPT